MTTKVTVQINSGADLLDNIKAVQLEQRQADRRKREQREDDKKEEKIEEQEAAEEDSQKGAIADLKEKKKRKNKAQKRQCGFWIYKDYKVSTAGNSGFGDPYRSRLDGPDIYQISVGSGDGTQWATHYIEAPSGKPNMSTAITGSMTFVGYLAEVRLYLGTGFGTVYSLPEGAIVTPYDPMVYLEFGYNNNSCPNQDCRQLYFPDELNSGPGKSRKMVTAIKRPNQLFAQDLAAANQAQFCFPVNNDKTVIVVPTWVHWNSGSNGDYYDGAGDSNFTQHATGSGPPSIEYTVYYKKPGGEETGWTPIRGGYWMIDPEASDTNDSLSAMNYARFAQVFPLNTTAIPVYAGKYDMTAFVVSHNKVKKLNSIPSGMVSKVRARCPEPSWDSSYPNPSFHEWNVRTVNNQIPGYPPKLAEDYNNSSWEMNPDARAMGIARNIFWSFRFDGVNLPYDYWQRDVDATYYQWSEAEAFKTMEMLGVSPGGYDAYDNDLQDHKFYSIRGFGEWEDLSGYRIADFSTYSNYGEIRLHAPDITRSAWKYLYEAQKYQVNSPTADQNTLTRNDMAWMYLNTSERLQFASGYFYKTQNSTERWDYDPGTIPLAHEAPDNAEFNYLVYKKSDDPSNPRLQNGIRFIATSWVDANDPPFNYENDPFYSTPFMNVNDAHWKRYKFSTKLSRDRAWPPSISQGITDVIPASASLGAKQNHPLAAGRAFLTLGVNTAWDKDYSEVLFGMGFSAADLAL